MTMNSTAFVPGFEHFNDEYIAPREVTLDPPFGRRICFGIAESDRDYKTLENTAII